MYFIIFVIASHHRWRGNPVNYARAYARLYYDWIATVAMLPRDDKKHRAKFPSMEGCRAAAGWSENTRMYYILIPPCHPGAHYILIPPCHPGAQGPHHTHLSSWGAGSPQKRMFLWGVF